MGRARRPVHQHRHGHHRPPAPQARRPASHHYHAKCGLPHRRPDRIEPATRPQLTSQHRRHAQRPLTPRPNRSNRPRRAAPPGLRRCSPQCQCQRRLPPPPCPPEQPARRCPAHCPGSWVQRALTRPLCAGGCRGVPRSRGWLRSPPRPAGLGEGLCQRLEHAGGVRRAELNDGKAGAGLGKRRGSRRRRGGVAIEADVARQQDLRGVPPEIRAMPVKHVPLAGELLDCAAREVAMPGEAGCRAKRAPPAAATDAGRRVRPLDRLGVAAGAGQLIEASVKEIVSDESRPMTSQASSKRSLRGG